MYIRLNSALSRWPEGQSFLKPLYLQRRGDAKELQQRWEMRGVRGRLPLLELLLVDCGGGDQTGVSVRMRGDDLQ